jgi:hypothetical protein
MNRGCGMKDYHSTSAWCNMKELATQMKRFARFHKVYGETKLPFTPPKWGSGRTRTYVHKPGVTPSHDDEYWDKWLEESWKKADERFAKKSASFPVQDTNRLEALYAIFMLKGMKNSYFEAMHPVKWCAEHAQERPSSQLAANIRNLVECYRCHRYFEMDDTELLYATGEEYCKYCYLTAAEMLGMLDHDWYELATTIL